MRKKAALCLLRLIRKSSETDFLQPDTWSVTLVSFWIGGGGGSIVVFISLLPGSGICRAKCEMILASTVMMCGCIDGDMFYRWCFFHGEMETRLYLLLLSRIVKLSM